MKPMPFLKFRRSYIWILAILIAIIILFPIAWVFTSSITPAGELFTTPIHYIPLNPTLANYQRLFETLKIGEKIKNTLIITFSSLILSTIVCTFAAYAFNRYTSKGLTVVFGCLLATSLIPPIVTARPLYDFIRSAGLIDTFPGLILLYTSSLIPFSVVILTGFFNEIPVTIEEAAEVDGCSFFQKFFYIILPVLRPGLATISIINFISCLNDLFTPLFFASKIEVLSVAITTIPRNNAYSVPWDLTSAMGWIILLPIIGFVAIFQKQIMEGIMAGGIKG